MVRMFIAAGALLLAAGCGAGASATPAKTATPSASVSFDDMGHHACQDAAKDAWLSALDAAKLSAVKDLQDLALREEQLGNHDLIKAWCAEHYRG